MERTASEADHLVSQSGANFRVRGTDARLPRPWQLAITPLVVGKSEWDVLANGLRQRTRVLEAVLADLLGPQRLLKERILPAQLLSDNPYYRRAYHGLPCIGPRLGMTATDLARNADGSWWVTSDRTRAPSGLGYALENRVIMGRLFPNLMQRENVIRLASFFVELQRHFQSLCPSGENGRVAILTPGRNSYRYVEDAYLARYLGYTLVRGTDLAVRANRLNLKTLGGLLPIEALWRHISDQNADPLELNPSSLIGVTGLLQAVRGGTVAVTNPIGSSIAQMPALLPFLPAAANFLFSEELKLPCIPTYWCGQPSELQYVLEHLDDLLIRPAFEVPSAPTPDERTHAERAELMEQIQANPSAFIAQRRPSRSTTPVWNQGRLHRWGMALRSFQLQTSGDVHVLPGGLARVSPDAKTLDHSPNAGRLGLDAWVIADHPVDQQTTLISGSDDAIELRRVGDELPSRVAETLFWLGRNAERTESIARLMRATLDRISGENRTGQVDDLRRLVSTLAAVGQISPDYAIDDFAGALPPVESILPKSFFDTDPLLGMAAAATDMSDKAMEVHDRISTDAYGILTGLPDHFREPSASRSIGSMTVRSQSDQGDLAVVMDRLDAIIRDLLAFAGLAAESSTRTHGWRFLDLGRRIERAYQTTELLMRALVVPIPNERPLFETVLRSTDCLMTYRSRYLLHFQASAVLDLLICDETNPRSVLYQIRSIQRTMEKLPVDASTVGIGDGDRLLHTMCHAVLVADPVSLAKRSESKKRETLNQLLAMLQESLPLLSDAVSARYLIHTSKTQSLTGRVDGLSGSSVDTHSMDEN